MMRMRMSKIRMSRLIMIKDDFMIMVYVTTYVYFQFCLVDIIILGWIMQIIIHYAFSTVHTEYKEMLAA